VELSERQRQIPLSLRTAKTVSMSILEVLTATDTDTLSVFCSVAACFLAYTDRRFRRPYRFRRQVDGPDNGGG
jgi:hypothetical protein